MRISYGDYQLQTIPPGMAIEVPVKSIERQKHKGPLFSRSSSNEKLRRSSKQQPGEDKSKSASPIQWVRRVS